MNFSKSAILKFLETDAAGGMILAACAVIALVVANSEWAPLYRDVLHTPLPIRIGVLEIDLDVEAWIKDGLMSVFFFVVGLELKRELVVGELSNPRVVMLPVAAALGGMIVPSALYAFANAGGDLRGWPVPVATDIAFAVAALGVLGRALPGSLRIFLLTLAVVDDLGAVVLIALLFSHGIEPVLLAGVAGVLAAMLFVGTVWRSAPAWLYPIGAALVWVLALKSGIHTSVAGVAAAFMVPPKHLERLEQAIHPLSAYIVLPLFALSAAGIPLVGLSLSEIFSPVPLGIALGLVLGKPLGVLAGAYAVILPGLAQAPSGARPIHLLGVACLCGLGFTMSLFIAALAFRGDAVVETEARLGVLAGSVLALVLGALVLAPARPK